MLNPPIKNLGVKGIRHFAGEIPRWSREYTPRQYALGCEMTYIYLDEDGTGGGCFRYLYSRFLEESGKLLENKQLVALSREYCEVGEKWAEVAHLIKRMPQTRAANSAKAKISNSSFRGLHRPNPRKAGSNLWPIRRVYPGWMKTIPEVLLAG